MSSYCPRGQRKNRKTGICEPYLEKEPKYSRCPKGERKNNPCNSCNANGMIYGEKHAKAWDLESG